MPDVHALLSASSSKQWLHCTPSARLQENFPNESSVYAEEGTFAHSVCEYKVRKYLHDRVQRPQSEEFDSEEVEQCTDIYYDFAVSIINLVKELRAKHESIISNQIGRSGTSIGANIREAQYAHGKADFIAKLQIALKEANETGYWL